MPDASTKTMHKVCNYLYWMDRSKIKLKFGSLTKDQMRQCMVSKERKTYTRLEANANDELIMLPIFELL
jgi:hypothetical protein